MSFSIRSAFAALAAVVSLAVVGPARADEPQPSTLGAEELRRGVGFDQRIGERLPLDAAFRDETGATVPLSKYFGRRPVVLALVYNDCPMLCSLVLSGLTGSLRAIKENVGEQLDILAVSFDPNDTPETAQKKKDLYVRRYGRAGSEVGFHFLTGELDSITRLTQAVGFRYELDPKTKQYAHAAGVVVVMPDGTISRYLYGSEFSPRDLSLATAEAAEGKTSFTNQLLLLCYQYDPKRGTYAWASLGVIRLGGVVTLLVLGSFVAASLRNDRRRQRARSAQGSSPPEEAN